MHEKKLIRIHEVSYYSVMIEMEENIFYKEIFYRMSCPFTFYRGLKH